MTIKQAMWKKKKNGYVDKVARLEKFSQEDEESLDFDKEEEGPQPEDIIIADSQRGGVDVSEVAGKSIAHYRSNKEAERAIKQYMEKHQFWPSVWYRDDHGGIHPYEFDEEEVKADIKKVDVYYEDMDKDSEGKTIWVYAEAEVDDLGHKKEYLSQGGASKSDEASFRAVCRVVLADLKEELARNNVDVSDFDKFARKALEKIGVAAEGSKKATKPPEDANDASWQKQVKKNPKLHEVPMTNEITKAMLEEIKKADMRREGQEDDWPDPDGEWSSTFSSIDDVQQWASDLVANWLEGDNEENIEAMTEAIGEQVTFGKTKKNDIDLDEAEKRAYELLESLTKEAQYKQTKNIQLFTIKPEQEDLLKKIEEHIGSKKLIDTLVSFINDRELEDHLAFIISKFNLENVLGMSQPEEE